VTHAGVDDLGAVVPLAGPPRSIASLVPNVTELVASWGLADRLVAVTDFCVEPDGAFPAARRVRGTKNPDLAALRALAPELVLANEEENRELDVRRLREAGSAVHVTRVRSLADLPGSLLRLGRHLGVAAEADALVARLGALPSYATGPRVACAVWRDGPDGAGDEEGWWLLGRDTYGASVVAAAGGRLVPDDPAGRYPRRSLADLRAAAPDLVLLPDEPYAFTDADVEDLAARGLRAVRVDGKALWWWGQRTPAAVATIAQVVRAAVSAS
jgi:ABC-type Fe3+-hydroxamate transport system substrate-binding protein